MPCCTGKRKALLSSLSPATPEPERVARPAAPSATATFEYAGATGLTATGAITGRRYRFEHTGAVVDVDLRDAPSLAGVPGLRRRR